MEISDGRGKLHVEIIEMNDTEMFKDLLGIFLNNLKGNVEHISYQTGLSNELDKTELDKIDWYSALIIWRET